MMKNILFSFILVVSLVLGVSTNVCAYSKEDYKIDIPNTFISGGSGYFSKNGKSIIIDSISYNQDEYGYPYTQDNLDYLVEKTVTSGQELISKEITTFTKNNYKCMIVRYINGSNKYDTGIVLFSKNKLYTIFYEITDYSNKKDVNDTEMENIISSFTINGYQEPIATSSTTNKNWRSTSYLDKLMNDGKTSDVTYGNSSYNNYDYDDDDDGYDYDDYYNYDYDDDDYRDIYNRGYNNPNSNSGQITNEKKENEGFPVWVIFAIGGAVAAVVIVVVIVNKNNKNGNNNNMNTPNMYNQNMNNQYMNNSNMNNQNPFGPLNNNKN